MKSIIRFNDAKGELKLDGCVLKLLYVDENKHVSDVQELHFNKTLCKKIINEFEKIKQLIK